jgi:nitroreductase
VSARDSELYQAILKRRSTRRYDPRPLDDRLLDEVVQLASEARPLVEGNTFGYRLVRRVEKEDLGAFLGMYGALVSVPHLLVPHIVGGRHALTDLGFRMEQVAVRITAMGLASCFIGALSSVEAVNRRFGLVKDAAVGAALVVGRAPKRLGSKAVNAIVRGAAGGTGRRAMDTLCFDAEREAAGDPPPAWDAVLEAGRWAPSARNVQPWRFLREGHLLHVAVVQRAWRYGHQQAYRWFDVGACLGNMHLAAISLGRWLAIDLAEDGRALAWGDQDLELAATVRLAAAPDEVS